MPANAIPSKSRPGRFQRANDDLLTTEPPHRSKLEIRTLNGQIREPVELPVPIRGQWIKDDRYRGNAAWFVRNYRLVGHDDNMAVAKLCYAVKLLIEDGEPIESVVPSLVDLFMRP